MKITLLLLLLLISALCFGAESYKITYNVKIEDFGGGFYEVFYEENFDVYVNKQNYDITVTNNYIVYQKELPYLGLMKLKLSIKILSKDKTWGIK